MLYLLNHHYYHLVEVTLHPPRIKLSNACQCENLVLVDLFSITNALTTAMHQPRWDIIDHYATPL